MSIHTKVIDLFVDRKNDDGEPEAAASEELATDRAGLYECMPCDTTFISGSMDSCPYCGSAVDGVPTAKDLGLA